MANKTIALASDHAGYPLKAVLAKVLKELDYEVLDFGTQSTDSVDYPDYIVPLAGAIKEGKAFAGVLVCGSGMGMCMGANRYPFIRAALIRTIEDALLSRQHNDANVAVFGGRVTSDKDAVDALKVFLTTPFMEGHHTPRIEKLTNLPR
ncbi:MAG: RpiB/LacA/LacB family sugar-phosphate isomerase [Alphaproteobacteria bacterium]|nr:RpiB/LacA/LacB family sugar-phosphate isomerase [Alphaproteobacteria bacterium]